MGPGNSWLLPLLEIARGNPALLSRAQHCRVHRIPRGQSNGPGARQAAGPQGYMHLQGMLSSIVGPAC
jgi:hypothetical protein